jgi:hypothetical protein
MTAFCSIVEYTLSDEDAAAVGASPGETLPALVIRSGDEGETLQVFDGLHGFHVQSAREGDGPGTWKHSTLSAAAHEITAAAARREKRRGSWPNTSVVPGAPRRQAEEASRAALPPAAAIPAAGFTIGSADPGVVSVGNVAAAEPVPDAPGDALSAADDQDGDTSTDGAPETPEGDDSAGDNGADRVAHP